MEREDEQWRDIVNRLGDDIFADVPDIIATPIEQADSRQVPLNSARMDSTDVAAESFDDEEAFIAPRPALPRTSRRTRFAWSCVGAGIGLLVSATLIGFADVWSSVLGWALLLTGAGVLFTRMPTQRDEDDDGAVV